MTNGLGAISDILPSRIKTGTEIGFLLQSALPAKHPSDVAVVGQNSTPLNSLIPFISIRNAIGQMSVKTVKVSNLSLSASNQDIKEFFSFSGEIIYVEMRSESDGSQDAYVTFKDSQGAETAVLLTGSTIIDHPVVVTLNENYHLPPEACKSTEMDENPSAVQKAEDVMSSMLAKGFVLGKDALMRAKSFDGRHGLTSNASATVASLDRRMGLSEKFSTGTAVVNEKVREVDEKFQVSQMTRSAFAAAEQKASSAGSAILSNPYVLTGASWVSSAFSRAAKAAGDVGSMTKEKVVKAEEEKKETISKERTEMVNEYAQLHLDDESYGEPATVPAVQSAAPVVDSPAQVIAVEERKV